MMHNSSLAKSVSVSVRIYSALLLAYPKKFREHYETQMVQVFRDSFRDAYRHNGMPGVIDLWLHTLVDLAFTAFIERIMEGSQYMFSPKVILWGGVAGVFCGLFWLMLGLAPNGRTFVIALVLGLGGLAGLYSRQAREGGKLGLAGFALGIIGTVLTLVADWWSSTPTSEAQSTLGILPGLATLGIGLTLLGVASLRAKTLHPWRGLPLGLGLLNTMLAIVIWRIIYIPLSEGRNPWNPWPPEGWAFIVADFVLLGLGWIALGTMLASEGDAQIPVAQPPPDSA